MPKVKLKFNGFTLVEMAIVLVLMGLILGTGLTILSAQQEQRRVEETKARLEEAREALIGFAIANGRLPCPASSASNGKESFCTRNLAAACGAAIIPPDVIPAHGRCTNPYDGFLPAATLGLNPTDAQGYILDAWGTPQNRVRYAVYGNHISGGTGTTNYSTFTANGEMAATNMTNIALASPLISVCDKGSGITVSDCGTATSLSSKAVAVIYSLGGNAMAGGTSANEAANLNSDTVFVSRALTSSTETGGVFDDQVTWLSPYILFNRMVQAGRLP